MLLGDREKSFAMYGARAMGYETGEMQGSGVAFVLGEAVEGIFQVEPDHDAVACDFGQDACGGNAF